MLEETDVNYTQCIKQLLLKNIRDVLFALMQEMCPNRFVLPMFKVKLLKRAFKMPTAVIRISLKQQKLSGEKF